MTRVFAHDGLAIAVEAAEADLEWLEEFLAPAFTVTRTTAAVHVSFEPAPRSRFESGGQTPAGRVAFALDSGPIRLAERPGPDGIELSDASGALAFTVTPDGRRARVFHDADPVVARIRLMRVVREYALNHSIRSGGLMLHAAAVAVNGRAVAIPGSKGAGKTTLALRLLTAPGVDYLSNDRVLARSSREIHALAVPTVVAVRAGTRRLIPELVAGLHHAGDLRESARERRLRGPAAPNAKDDTWRVSPAQIGAALERPLRATAPLGLVLFPSRTGPAADGRFRRLDPLEAGAALADALFCRQIQYGSQIFVQSEGSLPDEATMAARSRALAERIPCFAGHVPDEASMAETLLWLRECLHQRQ